jgi:hypothetical protein
MKKLFLLLLVLVLSSCEKYVTEISDVTLMGLYVVSEVEVISTDPQYSTNNSYHGGQVFQDNDLPVPFNYIKTNDFHINFFNNGFVGNFGVIWENRNQTSQVPIWRYDTRYPSSQSNARFSIFGNNSYYLGSLVLNYYSAHNKLETLTFRIEKDGYESLQLLSSGTYPLGQYGESKLLRLYLTRIHP